jgi:hypothetical protein
MHETTSESIRRQHPQEEHRHTLYEAQTKLYKISHKRNIFQRNYIFYEPYYVPSFWCVGKDISKKKCSYYLQEPLNIFMKFDAGKSYQHLYKNTNFYQNLTIIRGTLHEDPHAFLSLQVAG